jgi:IS5 family transposase
MRESRNVQSSLVFEYVDHQHARELDEMGKLLRALPECIWNNARRDLTGGRNTNRGRRGMSAEQVVRVMVVKQMTGASYEKMSHLLLDSRGYGTFCGLPIGKSFSASALQDNVSRLSPSTLESLNRALMVVAKDEGIERGEKLRADTTNIEANIHEPTDSSLLGDANRVLVRLMKQAHKEFGIKFTNHGRRAKKRVYAILYAAGKKKLRNQLYADLLKVTAWTLEDAERVATELRDRDALLADAIATEIGRFCEFTKQVVDQTTRRIVHGEKVPHDEKLVSIFETHTNILVKGQRDVEYGHKVCLSTGASGLITDVMVLEGNPSDATLTKAIAERHKEIFDCAPRQAAFDGGFASQANLAALKDLGVEDVVFSKPCGLSLHEMAKSSWVFKCLRNFRTAIEGTISFLKRCFGLARCTWRTFNGFKSYVWSSTLSANLLMLARHQIARATT